MVAEYVNMADIKSAAENPVEAPGSGEPVYLREEEIRQAIGKSLNGLASSHREEVLSYEHAWHENHGGNLAPPRPTFDGAIDPNNPAYFPRRWKCHATNEVYVRRFLVLAAATGKEGPGPLVSSLAKNAGDFPIPVAIVPGHLSDEELDALS